MHFLSYQGPSGDTGPAGANGGAGPRVSEMLTIKLYQCICILKSPHAKIRNTDIMAEEESNQTSSSDNIKSYLKAKCLTLLCDHFRFRDLLDPMDPLARMVEVVPMEMWVLLVLVEPLDTLDLL